MWPRCSCSGVTNLRDKTRRFHGRRAEPTAAVVDAQSVKTSAKKAVVLCVDEKSQIQTYASWANPIEAHFGPAERRERARIRSEKGIRWGVSRRDQPGHRRRQAPLRTGGRVESSCTAGSPSVQVWW